MKVSIKERVSLLLGIKEKGKKVDFDHVYEKVNRDVKFLENRDVKKEEIIKALDELEKENYIKSYGQVYEPLESINAFIKNFVFEKEKLLNRSYILVWKAKQYYPIVGKFMIKYLKERAVSVVKIFSDKQNPISNINPIFVRYKRYKPYPQNILINDLNTLMEYVHDHAIDYIPYVHKYKSSYPDIFVLDLDAGKIILNKQKGFDFLKYVTKELYEILKENEIFPMIKFSGSRGFQIWAKFENNKIKSQDLFGKYREIAMNLQILLEKKLQSNIDYIRSNFKEISEIKTFTTSQVAHKEERQDKILIDWSSMKIQGDVRAPFSIHYKTGLVSLPVNENEIEEFKPVYAEPFNVLKIVKENKKIPELIISDPTILLEKLQKLI